jgi:hypothetical protein
VEYVFGEYYFYDEAVWYKLMQKLNLDFGDDEALEKQDKGLLDNIAKGLVENYEYDGYSDYGIFDCIIEVGITGNVINTYVEL